MWGFLESNSVGYAFIVVATAIVADAIIGIIKAGMNEHDQVDIRLIPQFIKTGILPYVGGLGVLAIAAAFIGEPFAALFYAAAAAATAKYLADIKDKLSTLLGVEITHSDGIGEETEDA